MELLRQDPKGKVSTSSSGFGRSYRAEQSRREYGDGSRALISLCRGVFCSSYSYPDLLLTRNLSTCSAGIMPNVSNERPVSQFPRNLPSPLGAVH